jgi:hypothetical protein
MLTRLRARHALTTSDHNTVIDEINRLAERVEHGVPLQPPAWPKDAPAPFDLTTDLVADASDPAPRAQAKPAWCHRHQQGVDQETYQAIADSAEVTLWFPGLPAPAVWAEDPPWFRQGDRVFAGWNRQSGRFEVPATIAQRLLLPERLRVGQGDLLWDGSGVTASLAQSNSQPAPEITYVVNGSRVMVFGYDSYAGRGIFHADVLGGGVYFWDGSSSAFPGCGIAIGYDPWDYGQNVLFVESGRVRVGDSANLLVGVADDPFATQGNACIAGEVRAEVANCARLVLAPSSTPSDPAAGEMYYDSTAGTLRLWTGAEWKTVAWAT